MDRWIDPRCRGCPTRAAAAQRRWLSLSSFLAGTLGEGVAAPPPIAVEDRQLAVLAAHNVTLTRRLANAQWRGQATMAKAEAAREQTSINQKAAAKMFKILLGHSNILNITKENRGRNRGSGCGGRSRGQQYVAAAATVAMALAANSGTGRGRQ